MSGQRLIRADLHSHTHFSKDGLTTPDAFARRMAAAGIDCVAVSDHNTIDGARAVERLASFRVIISEEIRSSEGEIIGYFLHDPVPKRLSPEETVRAIKEQGGIVGVPHPFDRWRGSAIVSDPKGGELFRATAGWRSTFSHVVVLDPRGPSLCFDPLGQSQGEAESRWAARARR